MDGRLELEQIEQRLRVFRDELLHLGDGFVATLMIPASFRNMIADAKVVPEDISVQVGHRFASYQRCLHEMVGLQNEYILKLSRNFEDRFLQFAAEQRERLEAKQGELERVQENFIQMNMEISRLQSSGLITEGALTDHLQKIVADAAATDLRFRIARTTNNIDSALIRLGELSDSAEAIKQNSTLDTLKKEAQTNSEMAAALAPGSATAKQAMGFVKSVDVQIVEARKQAGTAITAADKAKKLLGKLRDYIATEESSLDNLSAADLSPKQTEINNAKQLIEKILVAFTASPADPTASPTDSTATPTKPRASKITANTSVTKDNIENVIEVIKEQILNARVAEQSARTAKETAEREAAMTKQKREEASQLYERNSEALDQLFGLTPALETPVDSEVPDNPEVPASNTDAGLPQIELKKSLKALFELEDSDRAPQSSPQPANAPSSKSVESTTTASTASEVP